MIKFWMQIFYRSAENRYPAIGRSGGGGPNLAISPRSNMLRNCKTCSKTCSIASKKSNWNFESAFHYYSILNLISQYNFMWRTIRLLLLIFRPTRPKTHQFLTSKTPFKVSSLNMRNKTWGYGPYGRLRILADRAGSLMRHGRGSRERSPNSTMNFIAPLSPFSTGKVSLWYATSM